MSVCTCIPGLVIRLHPVTLSHPPEFQKYAFGGEGSIDIAKSRWLGFRLKAGTCLLTMIRVSIKERGRDGVTDK